MGTLPRIIREVIVNKAMWILGLGLVLTACGGDDTDTPPVAPTEDVVNGDTTSSDVDLDMEADPTEDGVIVDDAAPVEEVSPDAAADAAEEDAPVAPEDIAAPDAGPSTPDASEDTEADTGGTSSLSCEGQCGVFDPDAACKCNPACFTFGDCCEDVCDVCGVDFADECVGCTPDCTGVACGDDGCGGNCGDCADGFDCVSGQCSGPSCDGFCGVFDPARPCQCDEGCDDREDCCPDRCFFCGTEPDSGCWCDSACEVYSCGPEPCGNLCGTCDDEAYCSDGECVVDSVCDGVGIQGCCEGDTLILCDQGMFSESDCAVEGLPCGWTGFWYDCGGLGVEPSGTYPLSCGDI